MSAPICLSISLTYIIATIHPQFLLNFVDNFNAITLIYFDISVFYCTSLNTGSMVLVYGSILV